jgi:deazaflavin-dependent oxidoreductase (nitroreductase family)
VPIPGWVARFNRRVANPILRPLAGRLPAFGILIHRGRISGREYRTPVNVFPNGNEWVIALTYGPDTDWVENVLAAGACRLIHRGRHVDLAVPRIVPIDQVGGAIPVWVKTVLRALRVDRGMLLTTRRRDATRS